MAYVATSRYPFPASREVERVEADLQAALPWVTELADRKPDVAELTVCIDRRVSVIGGIRGNVAATLRRMADKLNKAAASIEAPAGE